MSNLEIWDKFADIDPKFTKAISGKSYKGTSPNPQYVIKCLTEIFGPVGQGFGWEVLQEGFVPLGDEILHWCRIRFWHTKRENFYESYGQTKALMKTRNGLMSDEDAPKKSLTDAIIKAASHVGIAANIFLGRWDDQKYVQQVAESFAEAANAKDPAPENAPQARKSSAQLKREDQWSELTERAHNDMLDIKGVVGLNTLWKDYIAEADDNGWTVGWKDALADIFAAKKAEILAQQDETGEAA